MDHSGCEISGIVEGSQDSIINMPQDIYSSANLKSGLWSVVQYVFLHWMFYGCSMHLVAFEVTEYIFFQFFNLRFSFCYYTCTEFIHILKMPTTKPMMSPTQKSNICFTLL